MTDTSINWKSGVDWTANAVEVGRYLRRPELKYGDKGENKARPLVNELCNRGRARRVDLKLGHDLNDDAVTSILCNVTMAMQGKDDVWSPENGGWYTTIGDHETLTYIVCPGFADAWKARLKRFARGAP